MGLKASPADQALLLDLHEFDTRIAQIGHRASSLPETAALADLAAQLDALRATLAERRGTVEDLGTELTRVVGDVRVVEERIARDTARLQSSSSVKDIQGLEQELDSLRRRLADLEEIELAVLERQEEAEAALAEVTTALEEVSRSIASTTADRDAALGTLAGERTAAAAARAELAGRLPADLLALYEKQRARYGVGASLLQRGVSTASGVTLTEDELQGIRAAAPDDVMICPSSDAILVRTDESGL
jgi:predicted  nucleic acid-binding Zn-ribbon protein